YAGCSMYLSCSARSYNLGSIGNIGARFRFPLDVSIGSNSANVFLINSGELQIRRININESMTYNFAGFNSCTLSTNPHLPCGVNLSNPVGIASSIVGNEEIVCLSQNNQITLFRMPIGSNQNICGIKCNGNQIFFDDLNSIIQKSDIPGDSNPRGIDIHEGLHQAFICLSNAVNNRIVSMDLNDTTILNNVVNFNGEYDALDLTIDEYSNNLFFLDDKSKRIGYFNLNDPMNIKFLKILNDCPEDPNSQDLVLNQPQGISIHKDPQIRARVLYITELGPRGSSVRKIILN
ncbi:MAG: hypothetical protein AAFO07_28375, partial [Bacteroidota bacterium]